MPSGKPMAECLQHLGFLPRSETLQKKSQWTKESNLLAKALSACVHSAEIDDTEDNTENSKALLFYNLATDWVERNAHSYWVGDSRQKLRSHAPAYPKAKKTIIHWVQQFMQTRHAKNASRQYRNSGIVVEGAQNIDGAKTDDGPSYGSNTSNNAPSSQQQSSQGSNDPNKPKELPFTPMNLQAHRSVLMSQMMLDVQKNLMGFIEQQQELGEMDSPYDIAKRATEWVGLNWQTLWPNQNSEDLRAVETLLAKDGTKVVDVVAAFMHDVVDDDLSNVLHELRRTRLSGMAQLVLDPRPNNVKRASEVEHEDQPMKRAARASQANNMAREPSYPSNDYTVLEQAAEERVRSPAYNTKDDTASSLTHQGEASRTLACSNEPESGRSKEPNGSIQTNEALFPRPLSRYSDHMMRLRPLMRFDAIVFDRTMLHVRVARDPRGHSHQMDLEEAQDLATFWIGVKRRLVLLGFQIGSGVVVADLHWLPAPTKSALRTPSDHHFLMKQIQTWPGWKDNTETGFCNIHLILEA